MSPSDPSACARYEDDLSAWLDHELDASDAAELRAHLAGCARCTARLEALRAVDQGLRALAHAPAAPDETERLERLRARLAAERAALAAGAEPTPDSFAVREPIAVARAAREPAAGEQAAHERTAAVPGAAREAGTGARSARAGGIPGEGARPSPALRAGGRRRPEIWISPPGGRGARARRRWLPASLVAAAAAAGLALLVGPPLLERTLSTTEAELAAERRTEALARAVVEESADPNPAPAPPAAAPDAAASDAADRTRLALRRERAPGHLGASADPGTPPDAGLAEAPALREASEVATPEAGGDDALADVAPEDRALVERLDVLERMGGRSVPPAEPDRLRANAARWRAMTASERDAARARWRTFQSLPADEQARLAEEGAVR